MPSTPSEPGAVHGLSIPPEDWERTPASVRTLVSRLQEIVAELVKHIEELGARIGRNSQNSNRPPSSDAPHQRIKRKKSKDGKRPGAKKGHPGHQQALLEPTETVPVPPTACSCGCREFVGLRTFHTHQHIELPEIAMQVTHSLLQEGECAACGATVKASVLERFTTGYGARLTALVGELSGAQRSSLKAVKDFCQSVLGLSMSVGGIEICVDRVSQAIAPYDEKIAHWARSATVNHVDETAYSQHGVPGWLWVMVDHTVAFFSVKASRSKEAFKELIGRWAGILVSDGYGTYRTWAKARQTCLAHVIRRAGGMAERKDAALAHFGKRVATELARLTQWAHAPPNRGDVATWYARMGHLIDGHRHRKDEARKLVRHLDAEMGHLWVFLLEEGVDPTNNRAETALRLAVLWRRMMQGSFNEKGDR